MTRLPRPLVEDATQVTIGRFEVASDGIPTIMYYVDEAADELSNVKTILHEFIHYVEWIKQGRPRGAAYDAWKASVAELEIAARAAGDVGPFERMAEILIELAKL